METTVDRVMVAIRECLDLIFLCCDLDKSGTRGNLNFNPIRKGQRKESETSVAVLLRFVSCPLSPYLVGVY